MVKVFVINLARCPERREIMTRRLQSLGLEAEFVPAVDGEQLCKDELHPAPEPTLSPGEVGCYLSHVRCWQAVVDGQLAHAVVLEDDVLLSTDFAEVLAELAVRQLPFDAIRLSALMPVRGLRVASLPGGYNFILPNKNPSGCQGYFVSLTGAKRLLARLSVPRQPVDNAMDRYWKYNLCIPVLFPCVVKEDTTGASTICGRMADGQRKNFRRHLARVWESKRRKLRVLLLAIKLRVSFMRKNQLP